MGLRHEELKNLVLPLISVDEFEPKIGTNEEVIVVAFYCKDELPAYDLEDFIDKGVVEFLNSEVSPNPDRNGNYVVFVEFKRQPNFWTRFFKMVKDIERATGEIEWKIRPYLVQKTFRLNDAALQQAVITRKDEYVPRAEFAANPEEYLKDSDLTSFEMDESHIRFGRQGQQVVFEFVGYGRVNELTERLNLTEASLDLMASSSALTNLRSMLGGGWDITTIKNYHFITKMNDDKAIVVRSK